MDIKAILQKITEQMELSQEVAEKAAVMIEKTLLFAAQNGIEFDEFSVIGFASHLANLADRMCKNKAMEPIGDDILDELDAEVIALAQQTADIWTETYGGKPDKSEQLLIAIHLQTARAKSR